MHPLATFCPKTGATQRRSNIVESELLFYGNIAVIIYTTSNQQTDTDEAKTRGAACFITKPNTFDGICKSIASVLTIAGK